MRRAATLFFLISIPLLLITTNVRWAASESRLYRYSFDTYDAEATTGIARSELDRGADELIAYFNNDEQTIRITVQQDGRPLSLFNDRETAHLADVKALFRTVFRLQEASLAFALVFVVGVFIWAREAPLRLLARMLLAASLLTLGLLTLFALLAQVGFDELFLRFHFLAFTNDLWRLNPDTDHLIQMFPHDFWFDAAMLVAGLAALEAALLAALSAIYLRVRRPLTLTTLVAQQPRA
ncbi:MAG: TIGR01906 family membrane protein [Chloroflexota bacterium]|nr:TIGR01906 family membrane protein [Chloroflexota bacterium]